MKKLRIHENAKDTQVTMVFYTFDKRKELNYHYG